MSRPDAGRPAPVLVLASRIRAEEKWLLEALERRKREYRVLDARTAVFGVGSPLAATGALMREISHYRSLYAARMLEHAGLRVVNGAGQIATCGDKLMTTLALHAAGVPTPRCLLALTPEAARSAMDGFGYPAVVKPLTGSWGRLVAKLDGPQAAEGVLETRGALPGPLNAITYIQEYLEKPGRDIRVLVAGGEIIGAVYRVSAHWRTNVAADAQTCPCPVTGDLTRLAEAAAAAIGPGCYGIDVLEDADGALYVNEVNHTPEFRGAARALGVDIAGRYIDYVLRTVDGAGAGTQD